MSTYDVKVWSIQEHHGKERKTGKPKTTYRVRWVVAGKVFGDRFDTRALAESFRSKLITAQREGVAFDEETGLPEPMARTLKTQSWYDHAVAFVDVKWPRADPKQRISIAESLSNVTMALIRTTRGAPAEADIRRALYAWSFNKARRDAGPPPSDLAPAVRWIAANTVNLNDLEDAALVRKALDALSLRLDGRQAAATTIARKRAVFYGALRYAVELRLLAGHPMDHVQWITPKSDDEVDRRSVINPDQAVRLLPWWQTNIRVWSRSSPVSTTPRCGRPRRSTSASTIASCPRTVGECYGSPARHSTLVTAGAMTARQFERTAN